MSRDSLTVDATVVTIVSNHGPYSRIIRSTASSQSSVAMGPEPPRVIIVAASESEMPRISEEEEIEKPSSHTAEPALPMRQYVWKNDRPVRFVCSLSCS
jgi:hypothetical protein